MTEVQTATNVFELRTIDDLVFKVVSGFKAETQTIETARAKVKRIRIETGQTLLELRRRIEAEGQSWWKWFGDKFPYERRWAEMVMKVAGADDPAEAYEEQREQQRVADKKKNEKKREWNGERSSENNDRSIRDFQPAGEPTSGEVVEFTPREPELREDLIGRILELTAALTMAETARFRVLFEVQYTSKFHIK